MAVHNKRNPIRFKVYYDRGRNYWSSFAVIVSMITMLGVFKDSPLVAWFFKHPIINFAIMAVLIVCGFIFVGYLDKKLKVREGEQKEMTSTNPYFTEIYKEVLEIKNMIKEHEGL